MARRASPSNTLAAASALRQEPRPRIIVSPARIEQMEVTMSWQPAKEAVCSTPDRCPPVETVIVPKSRDLGGFEVRRALPSSRRRMIGPFIFLDQMGPASMPRGTGIDVRPHPHIGLSTLTWLVEGEIMHRDSLGSVQAIRPGEVNWMTAGSGIAHSERTPEALRPAGPRLSGLQTWLALPKKYEEIAPRFEHHKADALPRIEGDGIDATLVAGTGWGKKSPVGVFSETIFADVRLADGATLTVPAEHEERGVYVMDGSIDIAGESFEAGTLLALRAGSPVDVRARGRTHLAVLGGEAADGPRHIWWNFVSSSAERIEQAKADWKAGRFAKVTGDDEFIPLPES
jgi:redox-sensitive bicupin YhaK (pirin superfamily)